MVIKSRFLAKAAASSLVTIGSLGFASYGALAGQSKSGNIEITRSWTRATPGGAAVGAGFMTITNNGKRADRLIGGSSKIAKRISIHRMTMTNGVMRMRSMKKGLEIPAGKSVVLKPGGYHLMLIGLTKPIVQGQPFQTVLTFEKAGDIAVSLKVEKIAAKSFSGKPMAQDGMHGSGAMTPTGRGSHSQ